MENAHINYTSTHNAILTVSKWADSYALPDDMLEMHRMRMPTVKTHPIMVATYIFVSFSYSLRKIVKKRIARTTQMAYTSFRCNTRTDVITENVFCITRIFRNLCRCAELIPLQLKTVQNAHIASNFLLAYAMLCVPSCSSRSCCSRSREQDICLELLREMPIRIVSSSDVILVGFSFPFD